MLLEEGAYINPAYTEELKGAPCYIRRGYTFLLKEGAYIGPAYTEELKGAPCYIRRGVHAT